jgi:glutamyl-tRNA synthetase
LAELVKVFSLSDFSRSPPRFDAKHLIGLNRKFLHQLDFDAVKDRLPEGAGAEFWGAIRGNIDMLAESRRWWEVVAGELTPPELPGNSAVLRAALDTLPPAPWDEATWKPWTAAIAEATGATGRNLFHPMRLALTGEEHGPEMARLLPLIGRERVARRLAPHVAARGTPG